MTKPTQETFLKDVAAHQLTIYRDDGVYRHVRFRRPNTCCMHFDLVTWPGHLAYTGDMGDFVFARLHDMFEFFRTTDGLKIDPGYWAEKIQATDRCGGHRGFSEERFREVINGYRLRWIRDATRRGTLSKEQRRALWEAVDDEVLCRTYDGEHAAFEAANEFECIVGKRIYTLDDFWDHSFNEYTYRFLWACYAIAWGIHKYDESKSAKPKSSP